MATVDHAACNECGRRYRIPPQMAGKRIRCKCGATIDASRNAGAGVSPAEPVTAGEQTHGAGDACPACRAVMSPNAVICLRCGYDRRTRAQQAGPATVRTGQADAGSRRRVAALASIVVALLAATVIVATALSGPDDPPAPPEGDSAEQFQIAGGGSAAPPGRARDVDAFSDVVADPSPEVSRDAPSAHEKDVDAVTSAPAVRRRDGQVAEPIDTNVAADSILQRADRALLDGRIGDAIKLFHAAIETFAVQDIRDHRVARAHHELARLYEMKGSRGVAQQHRFDARNHLDTASAADQTKERHVLLDWNEFRRREGAGGSYIYLRELNQHRTLIGRLALSRAAADGSYDQRLTEANVAVFELIRWLDTESSAHRLRGRIMTNLGEAFLLQGRLSQAGYWLNRALKELRDTYSDQHWYVLRARMIHGQWLCRMGKAKEAVDDLAIAFELLRQLMRPDDDRLLPLRAIVAEAYQAAGMHREAIELQRENLDYLASHRSVVTSMGMNRSLLPMTIALATSLESVGEFQQAAERWKSIEKHVAGRPLTQTAYARRTKARLPYEVGRLCALHGAWHDAIPYLEQAGKVHLSGAAASKPESPPGVKTVASTEVSANLSGFTYGPCNALAIDALQRLAEAYEKTGRPDEAARVRAEVETRRQTRLGPANPDPSKHAVYDAELHAFRWNHGAAFERLAEAVEKRADWRRRVVAVLPDDQKLDWARTDAGFWHTVISLAMRARHTHPNAGAVALEAAAAWQGLDLDAARRQHALVESSDDPMVVAAMNALREARNKLALLLLKQPDPGHPTVDADVVSRLQSEVNELEQALTGLSKPWTRLHDRAKIDWRALSKAVPQDAVLINIVRLWDLVDNRGLHTPVHYVAVTLKRDQQPKLHRIGSAKQIDAWVAEFRRHLAEAPQRIAQLGEDRAEQEFWLVDHHLSGQLFSPIWHEIKDRPRWVLATDGALSLLPLGLLLPPTEQGIVLDHHEVSFVTSAADVLSFGDAPEVWRGEAVVIADPDFDAPAPAGGTGGPLPDVASTELQQMTWGRLPGTRREAEALSELFVGSALTPRVLLDADATAAALLAVDRPRILHVATHGFFLHHPRMDLESDPFIERDVYVDDGGRIHDTPRQPIDPMLYSGLVFAGANRDGRHLQSMVTAFALRGVDLRGSDVVLSACETGLGGSTTGAGVIGLQRAIMESGARRLTMSLWTVPDQATAELMTEYYAALMKGVRPAQAIRSATLRVRDRREQAQNTVAHPYFYAAFVLVGDPGS